MSGGGKRLKTLNAEAARAEREYQRARRSAFWETYVDGEFMRMLDEIRRAEPDIPSRTKMVERLLVEAVPRAYAALRNSTPTR